MSQFLKQAVGGKYWDEKANDWLVVKRAKKDFTAATADQEIVALVTAKKIRVLKLIIATGATISTLFLESSTTTAISPVLTPAANTILTLEDQNGLFETAAGESLTGTTAGASGVQGVEVIYVEAD